MTFEAGADFASDSPAYPSYPTESSMSALAAFPWVRACVLAKSDDVAALTAKVMRGDREVTSGPVVDLLRQPSSRSTWRHFVRQLVVDYELTGNGYALIVGERAPLSLLRLLPARTRPVPQADGQIQAYEYTGGSLVTYPWERVVHVRQPSWADGPESVIGEGAIRALHEDLTAERASTRNEAKASQRGRFEFAISPDDNDMGRWSKEMVSEVREQYEAMARAGGGALVLGGGAKLTQLTATPQSLQSAERRVETRDKVLAVFSVPPSRVGLPTANYATQRQQMRTYWESLRSGPIAALEDALSWLASDLGERGDRIVFDLSAVEALQESRTERVQRVGLHILNGVDPEAAYALEGLDVQIAPVVPIEMPEPEQRSQRAFRAPSTESARASVWRAFIDDVHGPLERQLARQMTAFLREQAARMASRMAVELDGYVPEPQVERTYSVQPASIEAIISIGDELSRIRGANASWFRLALARAFRRAVQQLGVGNITFDPTADPAVLLVEEFASRVTEATGEAVRQIVMRGILEGQTIQQMQERLMASAAFSPSRALMVARTETTRSVNMGAESAYQAAAAQGVDVRKEWLSARDAATRPSHLGMDGQVVALGEQFRAPNGRQTPAPGGFGVAEEDINCRCTTLPVLDDDA